MLEITYIDNENIFQIVRTRDEVEYCTQWAPGIFCSRQSAHIFLCN